MHDDTTMEKFMRDHGIPNGVLIKRLGPRETGNIVEENGNQIPILTWLQVGLRFSISPLLNEVMA